MKIPFFKTPLQKIITSKAMLAGIGLIVLGGYVISKGNVEIGYGIVLNGFGYLGIRDAV